MDINMFFPRESIGGPGKGLTGEKERINTARRICERCSVRQDCLEFAIGTDSTGIWGGMDTAERKRYAIANDLI
jgi:hypothetical protein